MKEYHMTWDEVEEAMDYLSDEVEESGFTPTTICGISRGGLPGGIMLSHVYELPFETVKAEKYDDRHDTGEVEVGIRPIFRDENVLLFDDIVDTGDTMQAVLRAIERPDRHNVDVRTATIHQSKGSEYEPDFVWGTVSDDTWVIYPWEEWL